MMFLDLIHLQYLSTMNLRGRKIAPPPESNSREKRPTKSLIHTPVPPSILGSKRVRSCKRGAWTTKAMEEALEAVEDGMSIRKASIHYGIPATTLTRWVFGECEVKGGSRPKGLSDVEEENLVQWALQMCDEGRGVTIGVMREKAAEMCANRHTCFKDGIPGDKWWRLFKGRHPELSLRSAQCVEVQRVKAINSTNLIGFYTGLRKAFDDLDLEPCRIWNCDETGVQAGSRCGMRIVARKGDRNVTETIPKNREWLTTLCCVSAAGHAIPNLYIFKGKKLRDRDLLAGCETGAAMSYQKKAWITNELFDAWLDHFKKNVPGGICLQRPHLLICDGHGSHVNLKVIQHAKEMGLHIFQLPPHTSHKLQPLDVSCFGPMKGAFKALRHKYMGQNDMHEPNKEDMATLVSQSLRQSLTAVNIKAGFAATGIWPWKMLAVQPDPVAESMIVQDSEEEEEDENMVVDVDPNVNKDAGEFQDANPNGLACADASLFALAAVATEVANVAGPVLAAPNPSSIAAIIAPSTVVIANGPAPSSMPKARRSRLPIELANRLMVTSDEMLRARVDEHNKKVEANKIRLEKQAEKKLIQEEKRKAKELQMKARMEAKALKEAEKMAEKRKEDHANRMRAILFHQDGKRKLGIEDIFGDARPFTRGVIDARQRARARLLLKRGLIPNEAAATPANSALQVANSPLEPDHGVPLQYCESQFADPNEMDADPNEMDNDLGDPCSMHNDVPAENFMDSQDPDDIDETCMPCSLEDTHICSWDERNRKKQKGTCF